MAREARCVQKVVPLPSATSKEETISNISLCRMGHGQCRTVGELVLTERD